jgi:hypothetical protein
MARRKPVQKATMNHHAFGRKAIASGEWKLFFQNLTLKSTQAGGRGAIRTRNSTDLAATGESVVREFLKS